MLFFRADVVGMWIRWSSWQEDAAAGGVLISLNSVFAEVGVEARFFVEAVGLIDDECIEGIGSTFHEGA